MSTGMKIAILLVVIAEPVLAQPQPSAQLSDVRCGSYCLYIALDALGVEPGSWRDFEGLVGPPGERGYSVASLEAAARHFGLQTSTIEASVDQLSRFSKPFACIALMENHFVLIRDADRATGLVRFIDPPREIQLPFDVFNVQFSRKMLLLSPSKLEIRTDYRKYLWWGGLSALILALTSWLIFKRGKLPGLARSNGRDPEVVNLVLLAVSTIATGLAGCGAGTNNAALHNSSQDDRPEKSLIVVPKIVDFGIINTNGLDEIKEAIFVIKNQDHKILRIAEVTKSCTCTTVDLDSSEIRPGGQTTLKASIRVGDEAGPRQSNLKVIFGDRTVPEISLAIRWSAKTQIFVDPTPISPGRIKVGVPAKLRAKIRARGGSLCPDCRFVCQVNDAILNTSARVTASDLVIARGHGSEESFAETPSEIGDIEVDIAASEESGDYRRGVDLKWLCGNSTRSQLFIPIEWSVKAPVEISPSRLFLGQYPVDETVEAKVLLRSNDGKSFRIKAISCDDSSALQKISHDANVAISHEVRFSIKIPKASGLKRVILTFLLESNSDSTVQIQLPVSVIAR